MGKTRKADVPTRTDWHKNASGCWSLSLGERGWRVNVFQREPGSVFIRRHWVRGHGATDRSLETRSRTEARNRAEAFLRALLDHTEPSDPPLTLQRLWDLYKSKCARFTTNAAHTKADKRSRIAVVLAYFGRSCQCSTLTVNEVERFVVRRMQGGIKVDDHRVSSPVGPRSAEADLQLLKAMLNWATRERAPSGEWLLPENPLRGMELPKEKNPKQPLADYEKHLLLREHLRERAANAATSKERIRCVRLEMAVFLAEHVGRRIRSISSLRWTDIILPPAPQTDGASILWRSANDKNRKERLVNMDRSFVVEMRQFRSQLATVGEEWLFPAERGPSHTTPGVLADQLILAFKKANLPRAAGELWHAYRRKWATERKDEPTADAMYAGGWSDEKTFRRYQHRDASSMERVLTPRMKLVRGRLVEIADETMEKPCSA